MVMNCQKHWLIIYSEDTHPKYHVYDVEFGKPIGSIGLSKFIFSVLGITVFFLISFYLAIITVDEPATLLPPYFEKKNIYPELYKKENSNKK